MERPILNKNISLEDFQEFYWLKKELVEFCKDNGLPSSGGKLELSDSIIYLLQHGEVPKIQKHSKKPTSNFDWNNEILSLTTLITDNYRNTENVRAFFTKEIGSNFSFNVKFMNWLKANPGKTLEDAIQEWRAIKIQQTDTNFKTEIAPQFEYNKYIRAFLEDNPGSTAKEARKYWKIKSSLRGTNAYERKDLEL